VGDGGTASTAALAFPQYAALDRAGNLYVSDQYHCRLRNITKDRRISTIAGNGICGFSGDSEPAIQAEIYFPAGIAADSDGNIFLQIS